MKKNKKTNLTAPVLGVLALLVLVVVIAILTKSKKSTGSTGNYVSGSGTEDDPFVSTKPYPVNGSTATKSATTKQYDSPPVNLATKKCFKNFRTYYVPINQPC